MAMVIVRSALPDFQQGTSTFYLVMSITGVAFLVVQGVFYWLAVREYKLVQPFKMKQ